MSLSNGLVECPTWFVLVVFKYLCLSFGSGISIYIFAQFEKTRNILKDIIGVQAFSKYVGDNPGSNAGKQLTLLAVLGFGLGTVADITTSVTHHVANKAAADAYVDTCKKANVEVKESAIRELYLRPKPAIINEVFRTSQSLLEQSIRNQK
uniref:Uncharacterized protein n=1 Tax=Chlamydomonas moewusii TaxID=3054 RepID=O47548_CHLMO|nr:hypothetical protein [Chlamydomonas moewusii]AAC39343.1 unknown [Chlamydomonas moewusii]QRM91393.1 hypothetical protein [Chlamydomonas moewusii]